MKTKVQVSVEVASPDRHSFSVKLLSSVIASKTESGLELNSRNPDVVICLVYEKDLTELKRVFERHPSIPIVVCAKGHDDDLLKTIDGWIYGCKLPKRVPTPLVINATTHSNLEWGPIFERIRRTYGQYGRV